MAPNFFDGSKFLQHLRANESICFFIYDNEFLLWEWNLKLEMITGLKREECIGMPVQQVLISDGISSFEQSSKALFAGNTATNGAGSIKIRHIRKSALLCDLSLVPMETDGGSVEAIMAIVSPVAAKSPGKTKFSVSTIKDFLKYAPIPVFIVDEQLNLKLANDACYSFVDNFPRHTENLRDIVPPPLLKQLQEHIQEVISKGEPLFFTEALTLSGGRIHLYTIMFPVRNEYDKIDAIGGYLIDMTQQLEQQEQNFRLLNETLRLNNVLNQQNKALQQKQIAIDEANQALQEQKEELERVVSELSDRNFELDQIMYKTSHDLRSPLTSILGLLQLAKQEKDSAKIPEYHQYIENRVNKLDNFVKTMLTYAKSSRTNIDLESIDWELLVKDSLDQVHYLEHYPKLKIEISINNDIYPFNSDPMRVNIILNNLIANAVKYADLRKSAPNVKVRINNSAKGASIEVEDNGIGIPKVYVAKVFDMFFRATDSSEGSGLGLYIVKQTVERLKGTLTIESKEGEGTTIAAFLPHLTRQQRLKTVRPNTQRNKKQVQAKRRTGIE